MVNKQRLFAYKMNQEDRLLWNINLRYFSSAEALISNGHSITFTHVKASLCSDEESSWFFRYIMGKYYEKITPDDVYELLYTCVKKDMYEALCLILDSIEDNIEDVMNKKHKNHTLLQKAVQRNRSLITSRLIEAGSDVHILDDAKNNLLHLCVMYPYRCGPDRTDRTVLVKILVDVGVDKNARNVMGKTPAEVVLATGHNALAIYIKSLESISS